MTPRVKKANLKRSLSRAIEPEDSTKKPRRSARLSQYEPCPVSQEQCLPSPVTNQDSTSSNDLYTEGTKTPPEGRPSQLQRVCESRKAVEEYGLSSPSQDTQAFSQLNQETATFSEQVKDETEECVWGYLLPLDPKHGKVLVMKKRSACPGGNVVRGKSEDRQTTNNDDRHGKTGAKEAEEDTGRDLEKEESKFEQTRLNESACGGYLIGRHPECDLIIDNPLVSNRHALIFTENKGGDMLAIVEDLSSNGTFVNEGIVGRNKRRELQDRDEITFLDMARFIFRYPKHRDTDGFFQRYKMLERLGKGHFAEVYLCVEKSTGHRFAVKVFTKQPDTEERSKTEGLQQEIAILMGVSHPNLLCLKDTFDEDNAVYLVLELAAEGELFNWIVMKQKLTEDETQRIFIQLFQAVKYLHNRGIVHRDIKPENILLTDKDLHVKVADFGLAKIIGEQSFTTTLCGTPSYVAPEILENSIDRRYSRAVDIWSLGVVLYICLCGFPPFSDELCSRENPYNLMQQIKAGRFDYPSPYWDSVGDPALDLIDCMLTVDVEKRFTIDDCLKHPWTTQKAAGLNDSTEGLIGGIANLDFTKRKVPRERTLLSAINDVKIARVIEIDSNKDVVKVYIRNPDAKCSQNKVNNDNVVATDSNSIPRSIPGVPRREESPSAKRDLTGFMALGGRGDPELFETEDSIYAKSRREITGHCPR